MQFSSPFAQQTSRAPSQAAQRSGLASRAALTHCRSDSTQSGPHRTASSTFYRKGISKSLSEGEASLQVDPRLLQALELRATSMGRLANSFVGLLTEDYRKSKSFKGAGLPTSSKSASSKGNPLRCHSYSPTLTRTNASVPNSEPHSFKADLQSCAARAVLEVDAEAESQRLKSSQPVQNTMHEQSPPSRRRPAELKQAAAWRPSLALCKGPKICITWHRPLPPNSAAAADEAAGDWEHLQDRRRHRDNPTSTSSALPQPAAPATPELSSAAALAKAAPTLNASKSLARRRRLQSSAARVAPDTFISPPTSPLAALQGTADVPLVDTLRGASISSVETVDTVSDGAAESVPSTPIQRRSSSVSPIGGSGADAVDAACDVLQQLKRRRPNINDSGIALKAANVSLTWHRQLPAAGFALLSMANF